MVDKRQYSACIYCGKPHDTKDHIPSRIFLDGETDENWHKVICCFECNQGFSTHEVLVACIIECMIHNSTDPSSLSRQKIKIILQDNLRLSERISLLLSEHPRKNILIEEKESFDVVVLKTARGHVHFELGETVYDPPVHLLYNTLDQLIPSDIERFNQNPQPTFLPEVGSKALTRMFTQDNYSESGWVTIKKGGYRFCVVQYGNAVIVKFVLWEYLFAQVVWDDL